MKKFCILFFFLIVLTPVSNLFARPAITSEDKAELDCSCSEYEYRHCQPYYTEKLGCHPNPDVENNTNYPQYISRCLPTERKNGIITACGGVKIRLFDSNPSSNGIEYENRGFLDCEFYNEEDCGSIFSLPGNVTNPDGCILKVSKNGRPYCETVPGVVESLEINDGRQPVSFCKWYNKKDVLARPGIQTIDKCSGDQIALQCEGYCLTVKTHYDRLLTSGLIKGTDGCYYNLETDRKNELGCFPYTYKKRSPFLP